MSILHRYSVERESVSQLILRLGEKDLNTRRAAAARLGKTKDPQSVGPLLAAYNDDNQQMRRSVIQALVQVADARCFATFVAALGEEDSHLRSAAVSGLGQLNDACTFDFLVSALRDKVSDVRVEAVKALGKTKNTKAVRILLDALKDDNAQVRASAEKALIDCQCLKPNALIAKLLENLNSGTERVRYDAAQALSQIKDVAAVEPLISGLLQESARSFAIANIANALARIKDLRAVGPIIMVAAKVQPDLVNRKPMVAEVAWAIGELKSQLAVESLIAALHNVSSLVVLTAAKALAELKDPRAIEPLIIAAGADPQDSELRKAVSWVHSEQAKTERANNPDKHATLHKEAIDARLALLKNKPSSDWDIVAASTIAHRLGQLRDPLCVAPLVEHLEDESQPHRYWVAEALVAIGDPRAFGPLVRFLRNLLNEDRNAGIIRQRSAVDLLSDIPDSRTIGPLIEAWRHNNSWVPLRALRWFKPDGIHRKSLVPNDCVPDLLDALSDENAVMRQMAAEILVGVKDERLVEPLIQRLKDSEKGVRGPAAEALGDLKDLRAVEPIISALQSEPIGGQVNYAEEVRLKLIFALRYLGDGRAIVPLVTIYSNRISRGQEYEILANTIQSLLPGHEHCLSEAVLRQLTLFKDFVLSKAVDYYYQDAYPGYYETQVSLETVRKLASQELVRRGLKP